MKLWPHKPDHERPDNSPDRSEAYGTFSASLGPLPSQEKHQGGVIALIAFGVMAVFLFAVAAQSDLSNGLEGSPPLIATLSSTSTTSFEDLFLDGISTTRLKEYLRAYADKPHMAGSAQDYVTASYTKNKFEEFGIRAEIKTYYPLLPVPKPSIRVAITSPRRGTKELILNETTIKETLAQRQRMCRRHFSRTQARATLLHRWFSSTLQPKTTLPGSFQTVSS